MKGTTRGIVSPPKLEITPVPGNSSLQDLVNKNMQLSKNKKDLSAKKILGQVNLSSVRVENELCEILCNDYKGMSYSGIYRIHQLSDFIFKTLNKEGAAGVLRECNKNMDLHKELSPSNAFIDGAIAQAFAMAGLASQSHYSLIRHEHIGEYMRYLDAHYMTDFILVDTNIVNENEVSVYLIDVKSQGSIRFSQPTLVNVKPGSPFTRGGVLYKYLQKTIKEDKYQHANGMHNYQIAFYRTVMNAGMPYKNMLQSGFDEKVLEGYYKNIQNSFDLIKVK